MAPTTIGSLLLLLPRLGFVFSTQRHLVVPPNTEDPYLFRTSEHHQFASPIKTVAVIGAGPSGLQHAATLLENGFHVRLFERDSVPGGNWRYTEEIPIDASYPDKPLPIAAFTPDIPSKLPSSQVYKEGDGSFSLSERYKEHWLPRPVWNNLHTNSPSVITRLPNINYEEGSSWVLSNHQIRRHVRQYASAHSLSPIDNTDYPNVTSYSTRVERLHKLHPSNASQPDSWQLTLRKLTPFTTDKDGSARILAEWWTEEFDAVIVATGAFDSPHVPPIAGLPEVARQHSNRIYHSRNYRRPQPLSEKNLLIVGASVSASEIARDVIGHVKSLTVSVREHEGWMHPFKRRSISRIPANASIVPEVAEFESLEGIKLINGSPLTDIDEVILATGYRRSNPFLADYHNATFSGKAYDYEIAPILTDGKGLLSISFSGHYIDDPTLAFSSVRSWTLGRLQGLGFAKVWQGTARLPTRKALWDEYHRLADQKPRQGSGLWGTLGAEGFYRRFVTWLNNESYLHGGRLVNYYPLEDREVFIHYAEAHDWGHGYITQDNFTRSDNTPSQEYLGTLGGDAENHNRVTWEEAVWDDFAW